MNKLEEQNKLKEPRLLHHSELDSTNKFLQMISEEREYPSGTVILADYQTEGRGQAGNSWESERGKNLTFSVLLYPVDLPANKSFVISEMASLCVKYTLDQYLPDISVKWPNDVYYEDRKISGILIENKVIRSKIARSVIGIGINVNQMTFSPNIPNPVSMAQITGSPTCFDRMDVMDDFRPIFAQQSERLNQRCYDAIHNDYLDAIYRKEGYHKYARDKEVFDAKIYDIEPDGRLILERTDGSRSGYAFKEVTYVLENT
ncbi:MAG: biotin--[acetyl-CoA-carboxylase] ligase [Tannerella sp.]|jgi:BirA family biotin operon repressor/biotin-[acetyl-CoA-carboxylase] ligase|nr:biotin--[acetyl-CoA-carboxylase] ligase [Tannerella sp.]